MCLEPRQEPANSDVARVRGFRQQVVGARPVAVAVAVAVVAHEAANPDVVDGLVRQPVALDVAAAVAVFLKRRRRGQGGGHHEGLLGAALRPRRMVETHEI
jgi:hypothetical protein